MVRRKKIKTVVRRRRARKVQPQVWFVWPDVPDWAKKPLAATLFAVLAFLVLLAVTDQLGSFGWFLREFLFSTFGSVAWWVPLFFVVAMVVRIKVTEFTHGVARTVGVVLFLLAVTGFAHLGQSLSDGMALDAAVDGLGGGYLGFMASTPLRMAIGDVGAAVILLAILISGLILLGVVQFWEKFMVFLKNREAVDVDVVVREADLIDLMGKSKSKAKAVEIAAAMDVPSPLGFKIKTPMAVEVVESPKSMRSRIKNGLKAEMAMKLPEMKMDVEWSPPAINLLKENKQEVHVDEKKLHKNKKIIEQKLRLFDIDCEVVDAEVGPTVVRYSMRPSDHVRLNKITALQNDLTMALSARTLRIEAPIRGTSLVGLEMPNEQRIPVFLREIIASKTFADFKGKLKMAVGRDVAGEPVVVDLTEMPHMLIAGQTGSGKSVAINDFIISLLYQYSPAELKFVMIDPKAVELTIFDGIPHLLTPTIDNPERAVTALKWCVGEMDRRLKLQKGKRVRNIGEYNDAVEGDEEKMAYIVVIIDELADLMMTAGKEVEGLICRIAQKARSVGLHLIVGTQSPRVNVVTGLIKANIPTRMACTVATAIDSKVILDSTGAEKLLGKGDMLYVTKDGGSPQRIQCAFVSTGEVNAVVNRIKLTNGAEEVVDVMGDAFEEMGEMETGFSRASGSMSSGVTGSDDPMVQKAIDVIVAEKKASATLLQRRMEIGYARAAKLLDVLEAQGVVGPTRGSKPREIYM